MRNFPQPRFSPIHEPTHPRPLPGGERAFVRAVSVPLLGGVRGGFMVPIHPVCCRLFSGLTGILAALFCAAPLLAQERSARPARPTVPRAVRDTQPGPKTVGDYSTDIVVVRDAQEQALEQVRSLQERVEDPRAQAALESALKEMERSLAMLEEAKQSPEKLAAA